MIEDICLVGHERLVPQGHLHCRDALLVLFESEVGDSLFVEDLRVSLISSESSFQIIDRELILFHIKVALSSIP